MGSHILYPDTPTSLIPTLRVVEAEISLTFLPVRGAVGRGGRGEGEGRERVRRKEGGGRRRRKKREGGGREGRREGDREGKRERKREELFATFL